MAAKKLARTKRISLPKPGIDYTKAPKWWLTQPDEIRDFLESLKGVEIDEIGRTAGGRPILAAAWGERTPIEGRTSDNLASAIAGGNVEAFYGKERAQQTICFVGAAHGTEFEGTAGMLNVLNVIVTGKDLRGRRMPELAKSARQHRWLVIPILNVDGRERAHDHRHWINVNVDYFSMITQGMKKDSTLLQWPTGKLINPMKADELAFMGTYYNDAGVNLVYDGPFAGDCQPETTALIRYCRRELPDLAILSHSNNGSLVEPEGAMMPRRYRERVHHLAGCVGMRCARAGFAKKGIAGYRGDEIQFYQTDAVYHASGALPVLIEFPLGWQNLPDNHGDILDICTTVIDEISAFGNKFRFRPRWPSRG